MDGCTFSPYIGERVNSASKIFHKQMQDDQKLQNYLEGMSYGGQSEEDSAMRYGGDQVNYVNNL